MRPQHQGKIVATTKGTAIIWGVSSTNLTGFTAAVSGGYTVTGEDLGKEADKEEIRDGDGEIKSVYIYNGRKTLSLKCYPSGASADATSLPGVGDIVTVTSGDSDVSGNWICDSASKARKQDGIVEFDISLINYDGITE